MSAEEIALDAPEAFVSTGRLPPTEEVERLVAEAHALFAPVVDGAVSTVYPALAEVPADLFGISVTGIGGNEYRAGDWAHPFALMSVAKPFVLALVCDAVGWRTIEWTVGVDATGRPFNSLEPVERAGRGRTNPMVNAGAIATTALVPGEDLEARWRFLADGLSRFAGRPLSLDRKILQSALETNLRNRAIANLLAAVGTLALDPVEALELYTRQSCLSVDARDLSAMGATLADGGVNPLTGERVACAEACRRALAVMAIAGMYETSGTWLCEVGVPGKSGIGGGIVTVAPGKGALGTFSPRLDAAGNSVRGTLGARYMARRLGLDMFACVPASGSSGLASGVSRR